VLKIPHKLRKIRKQRAGRYHGWGQVGQHRKSGGRGGKGKAGGRKHFWIRTVKYEPDRYSKVGFKPPSALAETLDTINVGELEELAMKIIPEFNPENSVNELDLTALGIHKVLGRGNIRVPLKILVDTYSTNAKEKIEEAGGSVVE
jgi:large subunit ribosomal protein L15